MKKMRKNNKGFSLVELIIVIAIMIALIAVMGPQYVKYVQSSRDAVVGDAAESVLSVVKAEFASNNIALASGKSSGTVVISAETGNGLVKLLFSDIEPGANAPAGYDFYKICGVDNKKPVKSDVVYTITIAKDNTTAGETFNMEKVGTVIGEGSANNITKPTT